MCIDVKNISYTYLKNSEFEHKALQNIGITIKQGDFLGIMGTTGSGKTTALLAKLIILEKKMPFPDGSGVLILSHTNTAVEEIQSKLHSYFLYHILCLLLLKIHYFYLS